MAALRAQHQSRRAAADHDQISTPRPGARRAPAHQARPPRARSRSQTPMPANAMWQLWLPSDMERFVAEADANAESVLAQMDKCAETSWMMNMGSAQGYTHRKSHCTEKAETPAGDRHVSRLHVHPFREEHARGRILNDGEIDDDNYAASRRIRAKALGKRDDSVVALKANASHAIQSFKQPFDFVLMDHWKPVLTQRLFPNFSELQVRVDGVGATLRHRDAVDVAVRNGSRERPRRPRPLSLDT